ncbi:MAG: branched-chain amino acid ABC transporter permease [Caldimonas sp.]
MSSEMFFGQLLLGLIAGSFYAMLSLGLAVIFGLLNVINFAHGAQYMLGAFVAWFLLTNLGIDYWWALLIAPVIVGLFGVVLERLIIRRSYSLDHLYGLLLTFGLALVIKGLLLVEYSAFAKPYRIPELLRGAVDLGFMVLPIYRVWVIVASLVLCLATWLVIERTKIGSYLRAATENPDLVGTFGINVSRLVTVTYGIGVGLAALAGVMAAPIYSVSALMGDNLLVVVFAVVVIGGMGSILGAIITGFGLGVFEAIVKVLMPQASNLAIFVIMAIVLLVKPAGLFGKPPSAPVQPADAGGDMQSLDDVSGRHYIVAFWIMTAILVVAPFAVYSVFLMNALCFAVFALSFNLLIGLVGLGSFGQAMFLGTAGYVTGYCAKAWGWTPELAIVAGTACAALLGFVTGMLSIRRQRIYFAMITLALSEMVYFFYVQAPFTDGHDGMQRIPRGHLFGLIDLNDNLSLYYFVLAVFLAVFLFVFRIYQSPFGHVLKSIRENEPRAISLGYRVDQYKLLAFVLSATIAGLAGSMKAVVFQIASLSDAANSTSASVILMTLLGGLGSVFGPVVGAFAIVGIENYMSAFGAWITVIEGMIFVVCVLMFRQGLVGQLAKMIGKPL